MPSASYIELHARSAFSFLEGASLPEELASTAADLGQPALAIADAHGVYGAPRFHLAAKKLGLRALIGAEVASQDGSRFTLLVENRLGYRNLCRLITRTKFREGKPGKPENPYATDLDFTEFAEGLVCLTGGREGPIAHHDNLQRQLDRLSGIFGAGNVYVELQRHGSREQEARNQALVELAQGRLPLLATNGVTHATPARRELQDVLTCVRHKTTISDAGRLLSINAERYLKTPQEMCRLFADVPEACANTLELAARLNFTLKDLGYQFPRYPVPPGETESSYLRKLTDAGARSAISRITIARGSRLSANW